MFCSKCGLQASDGDVFCSSCGSKHRTQTPIELDPKVATEHSFEDLLVQRARMAKKPSSVISNEQAAEQKRQPSIASSSEASSKDSFLLFPRVTYAISGLVVLFGLLVAPFAYTLNPSGPFGGLVQFDWKLPTLASVLKEGKEIEDLRGGALGYLTDGYVLTIISTIVLVLITAILLRGIDTETENYRERLSVRLSQ